jgi:hypothetical protein
VTSSMAALFAQPLYSVGWSAVFSITSALQGDL